MVNSVCKISWNLVENWLRNPRNSFTLVGELNVNVTIIIIQYVLLARRSNLQHVVCGCLSRRGTSFWRRTSSSAPSWKRSRIKSPPFAGASACSSSTPSHSSCTRWTRSTCRGTRRCSAGRWNVKDTIDLGTPDTHYAVALRIMLTVDTHSPWLAAHSELLSGRTKQWNIHPTDARRRSNAGLMTLKQLWVDV